MELWTTVNMIDYSYCGCMLLLLSNEKWQNYSKSQLFQRNVMQVTDSALKNQVLSSCTLD